MQLNRAYTFPYQEMFNNFPAPYLHPAQSNYHTLGQNGYNSRTTIYPGKRPGMLGDYGPRQQGYNFVNDTYPLDYDVIANRKLGMGPRYDAPLLWDCNTPMTTCKSTPMHP